MSSSNGIHFLKIILKKTLRDGQLRVPTSFMKRYWEGISNPVTLKLPNKTEWKVEWKKDDGDIWFCNNGWKHFTKHVSLSKLQFVVFQYEGNSSFNVIVFGKNGLEIKYKETTRDNNTTTSTAAEEEDKDKSDCSLKILDAAPPSLPAKRPKSAPQSSQPLKKRKRNPKDQKERKLQSSQHHHMKKKTTNGKKKVEAHSVFDIAAKHLNLGSSSKDLKRIKAFHEKVKRKFHSEKDYFTCAIRASYIERDILIIPTDFYRHHLLKMDGRGAILFDDRNRTWNVKLKLYHDNQLHFIDGWKKFSMDNNLDVGDVCAFVLNKTEGLSFQVFHFAFEKEIRTPLFQGNNSDQEEILNRPSSSSLSPHRTPNSPNVRSSKCIPDEKEFLVYIKNCTSHLTIPIKYIQNFISESGKIATLRVGGNSWPVKVLLYKSYSYAKFSKGWSKFFQDFQLKQGDSCHFKLVNEEKLVFEVTINSKSKLLN